MDLSTPSDRLTQSRVISSKLLLLQSHSTQKIKLKDLFGTPELSHIDSTIEETSLFHSTRVMRKTSSRLLHLGNG